MPSMPPPHPPIPSSSHPMHVCQLLPLGPRPSRGAGLQAGGLAVRPRRPDRVLGVRLDRVLRRCPGILILDCAVTVLHLYGGCAVTVHVPVPVRWLCCACAVPVRCLPRPDRCGQSDGLPIPSHPIPSHPIHPCRSPGQVRVGQERDLHRESAKGTATSTSLASQNRSEKRMGEYQACMGEYHACSDLALCPRRAICSTGAHAIGR